MSIYGWEADRVDIRVNDELLMKKPHPCGGDRFLVLRVGMDFKLRCLNCAHEVMIPRKKAEKNVKAVFRDGDSLPLEGKASPKG